MVGVLGFDPVLGFYNRMSDIIFTFEFGVMSQFVGGLVCFSNFIQQSTAGMIAGMKWICLKSPMAMTIGSSEKGNPHWKRSF